MLKLSEKEKQDIIRHLQADEELPEKYRRRLFGDQREVELVWNGKTVQVCDLVLPFHTVEQVNEARTDTAAATNGKSAPTEWRNKLIHGDNKLTLSSLKNGPMREEIEKQGGIKLIYIDPPFAVGADFCMDIPIGDGTPRQKPALLEDLAYRDKWGKGADSFIAMMYERLLLMRECLAADGSIYVHCDWRVNSLIRLVLDEIFGKENFINQIEWGYKTGGTPEKIGFSKKHDHILLYANGKTPIFNRLLQKSYVPTLPEPHTDSGRRLGVRRDPYCELCENDAQGQKYRMVVARDIWDDIPSIFRNDRQATGYATQKPEALLARIVEASSNEGDLVADFFCGSGTTAAVAEKLGRRWLVGDLGKLAIHTTRKRLLGVQRQLKADGKNRRPFEVLNFGDYERRHLIGVNLNQSEAKQQKQRQQKEAAYRELVRRAYRAEKADALAAFHGKRNGRAVAIAPVSTPVTRQFIQNILTECRKKRITQVDILAFEFEAGVFPAALNEAQKNGIDIAPKYIPAEVFDKRGTERNQLAFHGVSYMEIKPHIRKTGKNGVIALSVELTNFTVCHSPAAEAVPAVAEALGGQTAAGVKIIVEKGQLIKLTKDKSGKTTRETLTESWRDWIDYWAVDFNYGVRQERIRLRNAASGEWEEKWTGNYLFENEWRSFRTKRDRGLEFKSMERECEAGKRKVAVKVVDIFGNDIMSILEVNL